MGRKKLEKGGVRKKKKQKEKYVQVEKNINYKVGIGNQEFILTVLGFPRQCMGEIRGWGGGGAR